MKTAWIVDDDEEMSSAVEMMLKLLKFEARAFPGAPETAHALLAGESPDVLILDINMPQVSGIDLLEFLRRRIEWKNLPVVMLSSEAADVQIDVALTKGADAYVTKPVSLEELDEAIKQALRTHAVP
jgi:DNA-binding response OmpR family regulator